MFGTIRRHQKWLWIVISGVTIVSFVAFFSPNRRRQAGWTGPHDYVGSIDGRPVSRDQYLDAYHEAQLRYLFNYGTWPDNDMVGRQTEMLQREVRGRLLLIKELDDLHVEVSEAAMAQWIRDIAAFHDPNTKQFNIQFFKRFTETTLPDRGMSRADFERFARHEVGIQHLASLAGTAGKLITPQEATRLYQRENAQVQAEVVLASSSNYLAQVTVDPAAIANYYTNQQALYRIPDRMQVTYVKFAASNYLADATQTLAKNTNFNELVETTYLDRGTNSFKGANGQPLSPEAAKDKIRQEFRENFALQDAQKKAVEFANELFEMKDKTNALEKLAAAKGVPSALTEPFTQYQTPPGLNVTTTFSQAAAKLTLAEPIAEQPIEGEDAFYLIELKRRIPSEVPPLDNIRERVVQDYLHTKALDLARTAGRSLHDALTNALAKGQSFQTVVSEKGANAVVLTPFSRSTSTVAGLPNPSESSQIINAAFSVPPGKVSPFIPTRSGGFVLYVKSLTPAAEAKVRADLPDFTEKLRRRREYDAFRDWFVAQERNARIVLPGDQQKTATK